MVAEDFGIHDGHARDARGGSRVAEGLFYKSVEVWDTGAHDIVCGRGLGVGFKEGVAELALDMLVIAKIFHGPAEYCGSCFMALRLCKSMDPVRVNNIEEELTAMRNPKSSSFSAASEMW